MIVMKFKSVNTMVVSGKQHLEMQASFPAAGLVSTELPVTASVYVGFSVVGSVSV